ncbi:kinase [Marinobacter oulmenensis]|uniref:Kinase n=1 Tax=Marinobacter oulmenensis TaxID=643747 RepID=A0A840UMK0_9GAMM|nr:kinase [Marinobacter oulmenensis]MBB5322077.1 hypothetical protein [Marinobacter oulmenensis]
MNSNETRYSVRALIITAVIAIIGTVGALEGTGRIDHSDNKDHMPVGDFQAIHLKPGEELRMSRKPSELHAACVDGYLAIAADVDPSFRGILVDYKNRGVRCVRPSPTDIDPAAPPAGTDDEQ